MSWNTCPDLTGTVYGKEMQLEVLGRDLSPREQKKTYVKYFVKCHKCALDPELFPNPVFSVFRTCISEGSAPCGCAPTFKWSHEQYSLRIARKCDEADITILSFPSGCAKSSSKVRLKCNKDGHEWESTINGILVGNRCWECRNKSYELPDATYVDRLKKLSIFHPDTTFTKLPEKDRWEVYCPVCADDEYSQRGLCDGKFKANILSMLRGSAPCRCSQAPLLTKEQCEYKIKSCAKPGIQFVRWYGEFKGLTSPFIIHCDTHGEQKSRFSYTSKYKMRCPKCVPISYFREELPAYIYVLRAGGASSFTGFGITNFIDDRKQEHSRNLKRKESCLDDFIFFPLDGGEARYVERSILSEFPKESQEIDGFRREATHAHLYDEVVAFVQSKLASLSHSSNESSCAQ